MSQSLTEVFSAKKKRVRPKTSSLISPLRKQAKTSRKYIPSEGSGAYAILIALLRAEEDGKDSLGKDQLMELAQPYTNTCMSVPLPGTFYSGFNSIKTLIKNQLVERTKQRYASYFLTADGRDVAERLHQIHCEKRQGEEQAARVIKTTSVKNKVHETIWSDSESDEAVQVIEEKTTTASGQTSQTQRSVSSVYSNNACLAAGSFDVVLFIDSREQTSGVNKEMRKTALLSALQQRGVRVEMRTLSVGDFLWCVQEKIVADDMKISSQIPNRFRKELVLDFVVERKRIDDLASSIKDRRWDEQKHRLKNCGVRRPAYLIEFFGSHSKKSDFGGLKYETLAQAVINAEVDGFTVKRCNTFEDTVRFLTLMTKYLQSYYKNKPLYSCTRQQLLDGEVSRNHFMTFREFETSSTKVTNFTVTEMFVKHLLQFRGVSVAKAKAIVDNYPTLQALLDAYSIVDSQKAKENLLAQLKSGLTERNFGPTLSRKIFLHYNHY